MSYSRWLRMDALAYGLLLMVLFTACGQALAPSDNPNSDPNDTSSPISVLVRGQASQVNAQTSSFQLGSYSVKLKETFRTSSSPPKKLGF